jgi:hypothetical protein
MKIKIISLLLLVFTVIGCKTIKRQIEIAEQREPKFKATLRSPKVSVGQVEAQLDRSLFGLKKLKVNVTYSPVEDALCIEFKRNTVTNYQFYNRTNRSDFLKALEKYIDDYDNRNLVNNNKTTKKQYGDSDEGYLIWKLTKVSEQYYANIDFSFGYLFKEKSPFFTITQGEAIFENIFAKTKDEKINTNGEFQLFFTRAQALDLANYFDPEFIQNLTNYSNASIDSNVNYESY